MRDQPSPLFLRLSKRVSSAAGHPAGFLTACSIVFVWALLGPVFAFTDTWQLVINTGTTIVTFLMVFLIQNTQNRDSIAIQLKLDELIRATRGAHNALLDVENLSEPELCALRDRYEALASRARSRIQHGATDGNTPELEEPAPAVATRIARGTAAHS